MADRFPLIANPSTSTIQEIPSGDTLDLTGNNIKGAGIITATTFSGNLTGSVTGNAGGLTGTPNVVVGTLGCGNVTSTGDVTGVNATFSGNLTVNGTTTTIDTAVTAVDSLAVDGNITALGSVGIGTDAIARGPLHIHQPSTSDCQIHLTNNNTGTTSSDGLTIFAGQSNGDCGFVSRESGGSIEFYTHDGSSVGQRFRITSGGALFSYSPDDTTPNFKFRSNDTNWFGSLNQSVEGGTITSFLSCGGDWDANGTTYNCTKNVAAYPSAAIALHNQYNSSWESKFVFLKKAGGSTTTDGAVTELASISSAGVISDSIGPLRRLGINNHNAATYTLVADDAGKLVREATNSANITIPQNVFSAGDMISIFNVSSGDNTITQGTGTTLYNTGDGATGNRTLAAKGVCTIVCTSSNEFIISGSGLS